MSPPEPTPLPGEAPPRPLGVYVHFPWCLSKCPYCDFLSIPEASPPHTEYANAVIAELRTRAKLLAAPQRVRSVFFGGGTPSLWEPRELLRVLRALEQRLPLAADCEVTVECNPTSLTLERATALREGGVGRLSIGVQSLRSDRLAFLGRLHDPEGARAALRAAKQAGFRRLSADLIFGLPGQPSSEALQDAEELLGFGLDHLSAYSLTIEPGTRFGELARQGRLPLAVEDHVAEAFAALHARLTALGLRHYEISNYALPGGEALHNLGYWRGQDYLGLGCGAWGTTTLARGVLRYRNTPSPARYLAHFARGEVPPEALLDARPDGPVSDVEWLDGPTRLLERLMLGLRTSEGLDLQAESERLGVTGWTTARRRAAARLEQEGKLLCTGDRIAIAPDAWILADGIISSLA